MTLYHWDLPQELDNKVRVDMRTVFGFNRYLQLRTVIAVCVRRYVNTCFRLTLGWRVAEFIDDRILHELR